MGFFKQLFGSNSEPTEQDKQQQEQQRFDMFKYDGVRALRTNQVDFAIKCFNEALKLHDDLEIHDYLSQALLRQDDLQGAVNELELLRQAQPDNIEILIRMARIAYMMEDYEKMKEVTDDALKRDAEDVRALYENARALKGLGDVTQSIAVLTQCITICGKEGADETDIIGDATLARGETLLGTGDTKGADADADWLLEHTQDSEDVYLLKARVDQAKGENDKALDYYGKVIDVNPFSAPGFKERGAVRLAMGDKDGAEEDMAMAAQLDPREAEDANSQDESEDAEDIQQKVEQAYRNINPFQ